MEPNKIKGKITAKEVFENPDASGATKWTQRAVFEVNKIKLGTFDLKVIEFFNNGDEVEAEYFISKDGKFNNITQMKLANTTQENSKIKRYRVLDFNFKNMQITLEEA
jgi:hypothetical protein